MGLANAGGRGKAQKAKAGCARPLSCDGEEGQ